MKWREEGEVLNRCIPPFSLSHLCNAISLSSRVTDLADVVDLNFGGGDDGAMYATCKIGCSI